MNKQLCTFTSEILSPLISAYRKGHNCQYSLMKLVEDMRKALDDGSVASLLLMDLSKAFDCLPHDLLAAKLIAYGMDQDSVQFLVSYLRHRQQRVKIGQERSQWMEILKGVPQGSILGPILFNIFLNDLMYILTQTSVVNYADDNTLEAIAETLRKSLQKLTIDSRISIKWFSDNDMQANPGKFQFLTTSKEMVEFKIDDASLMKEHNVKMLGTTIDEKLDFKLHVNNVVKKCAQQLNALRRLSRLLNTRAKLLIFHAFINSNLNYCPLIWINRNKTDMARVEKIQERGLRMVYNDNWSSYDELLKRAKVPSVLTKWKRMLATEVYKSIHNMSPSYIQELFHVNPTTYDLRASKLLLKPKCSSVTHGINSLSFQGAKLWNELPNDVKDAQNVLNFKTLIKNHIV
jgi:ribonuclease P/MRP protein subunit RPP40